MSRYDPDDLPYYVAAGVLAAEVLLAVILMAIGVYWCL